MNTPNALAERTTRGVVAGMIIATAAATVVGFWLSYDGLHTFALHARMHGAGAWAWPASVDLFILAGECGVTIGALRGRKLTAELAPWFYLLVGFGFSVFANVLHVDLATITWAPYAAAATPPIAAMLALAALLRQVYQWAALATPAERPRSHRRPAGPAAVDAGQDEAPRPRLRPVDDRAPRPQLSLPPRPTPAQIQRAAAFVDPPVTGAKLGELTGRSARTGRRWLEQLELETAD